MANIEAAILNPPYWIQEFLNSDFKFVISDPKKPPSSYSDLKNVVIKNVCRKGLTEGKNVRGFKQIEREWIFQRLVIN